MSEISINAVLDGITLALRRAFPDSKIEADTIEQGLTAPAFNVLLINAPRDPLPDGRIHQHLSFDVLYFPSAGREECQRVAEELFQVLWIIALPNCGKLLGRAMNFNIVDHVLHFSVSYGYNGVPVEGKDPMETLIITQGGA